MERFTIRVTLILTESPAMFKEKSRSAKDTEFISVIGFLALKTVKAKMTIRRTITIIATVNPMHMFRHFRERIPTAPDSAPLIDLLYFGSEEEWISMELWFFGIIKSVDAALCSCSEAASHSCALR